MPYPNSVFSAFAFLGFLMCAIPFPWHLHSWNIGTCLYMAWTGLGCLIQFVNSVVWTRNVVNRSLVWCDISAKFIIGTSWAIPAASLCINRRLYYISRAVHKSLTIDKSERRRQILFDFSIGLVVPILGMILHYIAQGHRFDILEDIGCYPSTYLTPVAYVLVSAPPIAIGVVSAVYCVLSIFTCNRYRVQFNDLLAYRNFTSANYIRLICLAGIEVLCTVPLGSYTIHHNIVQLGVSPWISWADTHAEFSHVNLVPAVLWRADPVESASVECTRWLIIVCAIVFFAFFGLSEDARKHYGIAYKTIIQQFGAHPGSSHIGALVFAPLNQEAWWLQMYSVPSPRSTSLTTHPNIQQAIIAVIRTL